MTYLRRNYKNKITSLFYPFTPLYNICQIVAVMVSSEKVRWRCLWISINPGSTNKPRGEQACEIRIYIQNQLTPTVSQDYTTLNRHTLAISQLHTNPGRKQRQPAPTVSQEYTTLNGHTLAVSQQHTNPGRKQRQPAPTVSQEYTTRNGCTLSVSQQHTNPGRKQRQTAPTVSQEYTTLNEAHTSCQLSTYQPWEKTKVTLK